ncbi:bifunctional DNA-formamidopyrimidine glycosylase/DNA-(apurinic or apyrimidinic site) lyase [Alphaproteobacteria bacterium]|nr:bifunctional DNA-formamidopyrimidine glycosylase/DNA-(apurinic or apyrimidinic site) lyase [Alphaproteobacteria bacterium]
MPELPEVETIVRSLRVHLEGKTINYVKKYRDNLRFKIPTSLISLTKNKKIKTIYRRGKYIVFDIENNIYIILHLGMSGKVNLSKKKYNLRKHDHIVFYTNQNLNIIYNDPRRFGMIDIYKAKNYLSHPWIVNLGPEPLNKNFDGALLLSKLIAKKTSIKIALLDQKVLAGIGNIYACESLYMSGISPEVMANKISKKRLDRLAYAIKKVLLKAIQAGGSSISDYVNVNGEKGYFQNEFLIYGKNKCPGCNCKFGVKKITQSGRSTFFCSKKQR